MNKYSKNFILCGEIDHHCLLCKESFQTVENLEKHIRWEKHRKSIKNVSCMPKFKKDLIYKVDNIFYCECCNCTLPTVADVSSHVEEAHHKENKSNPPTEARGTICKREAGLILIEKIQITNKEWNGVVESKCTICDLDIDNFVKHISLSSHMINLIKSEICKSDGDQYYRKINQEKSYCFMCKKTFETISVKDHWSDNHHLEKTKVKSGSSKSSRNYVDKSLDIAVKLINSQKDFFDIDLDNKVAICKICTAYVGINFQFMIEHKKTHNITNKDKIEPVQVDMDEVIASLKLKKNDKGEHQLYIFDHGKRRSELAKYGRNNFIKLVPPGGKGHCSLCNTYVSAHMKNFMEHVKGHIHMGHLELKGLDKSVTPHIKPSYKTKTLKNYLKSIINGKELKVLWINKHYCVDIFSFMLISIINENADKKQVKCYACDVVYDYKKECNHCQTEKHKQAFLNSEVVISMKDEFIREIRPNLYHCATCNLTFPFWETLDKHLHSWKHVFTKNDRDMMYKLIEQWYAGLAVPHLDQEKLYPHLMDLGIL